MLTPAELNQKAKSILLRELGPVDYARFFQQYEQGIGNYANDREQWLGTDSVEDIHAETMNLLATRKLPRPPAAKLHESPEQPGKGDGRGVRILTFLWCSLIPLGESHFCRICARVG